MSRAAIEFAILRNGRSSVELGWRARDARQRLRAPEHDDGEDSWIKVHGRVRCPEGEWEFADPCLTEHEAMRLVRFLERRPWIAGQSCEFLEPCLKVRSERTAGGGVAVEWVFRGEAAPPWIAGVREAVWEMGFTVLVESDEPSLERFARELRGLLGVG